MNKDNLRYFGQQCEGCPALLYQPNEERLVCADKHKPIFAIQFCEKRRSVVSIPKALKLTSI